MQYFDIPTIKQAIEGLQKYTANWLLPAFVFAANDVGTEELVDISTRLGTDQFLDRYFNGSRLDIAPFPSGNNLLRPRLSGIKWNSGQFSGDHLVRQDTKMWGNLFSSRGYREMRLEGLIEGEKAITRLTNAFQPRFEQEIPSTFKFEDFLIWLFAFEGFPDAISSWEGLLNHLLNNELKISEFKAPYRGRFKLSTPPFPWPGTVKVRPSNKDFLYALAPKLSTYLSAPLTSEASDSTDEELPQLTSDDPLYARIKATIQAEESLAFLLAGPPGTGKTRYARQLAMALADNDKSRTLFLQFHPTIGYDDLMEGFRPTQAEDKVGIRYELAPRLFLKFAQLASESDKKFIVVIDELNRGDVARIFGEVLTYVETDYRGVEFTLPFSGKIAVIPKNLIVIATANPFDRSVTDLDDALLRRFWVIELGPDPATLKMHLQNLGVESGLINRTLQMFSILNEVMPQGFGHTNFLKVRSLEDLAAIWVGRVRMALRRTFLHDRSTYDATVEKIEKLLVVKDSDEPETGTEPAPN